MLPGPSKFAFQSRPYGSTRAQRLVDLVFLEPEHTHHAALGCRGGRLHGFAAEANQPETGFEFDCTCKYERRVFAEGKPCRALAGRDDLGTVCFQAFEGGQAGDKESWLADVGGV